MSPRLRSIVTVGLLAVAAFLLYRPGMAPTTLTPEELAIVQQPDGYPLFIRAADGLWRQPVPIYFRAVFGAAAPGVIGALDVVLLYFAAACLLRSESLAVIVAIILMLFPAHAILGPHSPDAIYPVPLVIAWLICLIMFFDRPRTWLLFAGAMALGIGVYTQPSAPITMAALLVVGQASLWLEGHRSPKTVAAPLVGFGIPLLLMVPWFAIHPETYQDTMGTWAIHKAHIRFPLDGVRAFLNWNTLGSRTSLYWDIFNPSFLLFRDDAGEFSRMAPMLVPLAVLVPIGGKKLLTASRASLAVLLLAGLAASPLAAATFGERHALDRALPMVVFLSLIAGVGVEHLLASPRPAVRLSAMALLAMIPLQYFFG